MLQFNRMSGDDSSSVPAEPELACFRCGVCCCRYQVLLEGTESRRIADHLGISLGELFEKYADRRWPGAERCLLRQEEDGCVFLRRRGQEFDRSIHLVRPQACRDWSPGPFRRECRQGLVDAWGLSVDASGQIEGPAERLREFRTFLSSLSDG